MREFVQQLPPSALMPFEGHPFQVREDAAFEELTESVRSYGVLSPLLTRPKGEGYELVSGHRRRLAALKLGLETVPVLVREMSDDEAVVLLVDSNLQRENLLPSEKAFAYKMKLDALKHQGKVALDQVGAVDKVLFFSSAKRRRHKKRRLPASSHGSYHPFEVQSGRRQEAVVLRCL